ncbi:tRNA dimethylallyltransferase [Sphingomonas sp. Leaf23]|uniref:tRNA (adenosine(37)-N6)-dimethylallyltransferase MiaA n=1 Tax=Sphingomonas sp. Leaf23 TaxID=1735689 RepID=UPI0006FF9E9F|nr:tRNA (adenosine(37)-N6)-dimethylallyltransferase MiaA [Sphingomonas sp. Leaf23]KQM88590.1 tRNA dimethylallyltransferase [Sphingomonas sp. Leaf23]
MNMVTSPDRPRVALIAGPTASGKSALAVEIARRHDGVVINADSAQVYRDLRVLSARPSPEDEAQAPHRLFGHVDGAEPYSAALWAQQATAEIDAAHAIGKLPVLVGGTGLYLRTLIDGIAPVPDIDPEVRARIRALPLDRAVAELAERDAEAAARLRPTDTTRIARALEVVTSTGRTLTDWQRDRIGGIGDRIALSAMLLLPDRAWLTERCDRRLAEMFAGGAVEEVRALLARCDIPPDAPVRRAIGVAEIAQWQAGSIDRDDALAAARHATRQYAKRQYTWFRNQPPADWLRTSETEKCALTRNFDTLLRN